ncbi:MAG: TVP38/TMEM64 family protein [Phenylobacterium sp.]|uniref:TVP38/TMEM64 family protein n=1 Tax=Phenylobacterium sp. TaxID=1871053 RepID=UPI0025FC584C|nr:VTT domain-containing protein [Phenylobacterium sp.]MBI1196244.1 TVP38/TMEM64 family protein [Phenylobacterium sp.]
MGFVRRYWPLLAVLAVLIGVYASGVGEALSLPALRDNEAALRSQVSAHPVLAVAAFVAAYAVVTAASVPGAAIMTLSGGFLFGVWLGGAASLVGATAGATAIYAATRSAFGEPLRRRAEAQGGTLKRIVDGVSRDALSYILTVRLIPLVPFWLVNIAAGVAGAPLRAYVVGSFIGMAPATLVYSWMGAGLGRVFERGGEPDLSILLEPYLLGPLVGLALLSLLPVAMRRLRRGREA